MRFLLSLLVLTYLLTSCGGGGGTASGPAPPAPTVAISGTSVAAITGPVTLTFTFSQPMNAFPAAAVGLTSGTVASSTTMVDPTHYTLAVTPPTNDTGTMIISIAVGAFTDSAGAANAVSASAFQSYNTVQGPTWVLSWSDEFNGPDGSLPDSTKWTYDLGGNGWGNGELESYTSRAQNAQIQGGNLVISAIHEAYKGADGILCNYTSARLKTEGIFYQTYGRFEARIKIPSGQGMWPAFWMLGESFPSTPWPTCGEIDIMENIGSQPADLYGSIHGPGFIGGSLSTRYALPTGNLSDDFHIYSLEWIPGQINMYLDSILYATYTTASLPGGATWVFDQPFFLLLNVAVGGSWPGAPNGATVFPQTMLVDYVRVYKRSQY